MIFLWRSPTGWFWGRFTADFGTTIQRWGMFVGCTVKGLLVYGECTSSVMPIRPAIDEETIGRMNEELESRMSVSPESVGVDKRINVLLDMLAAERRKRRMAESRSQNEGQVFSQY